MRRKAFLCCAIIFVAVTTAFMIQSPVWSEDQAPRKDREIYAYHELFLSVYEKIINFYVEETDRTILMEGAFQGMLATLDRNNYYVTADEVKEDFASTLQQNVYGLIVGVKGDRLLVISALPDSSAEKIGLHSGDWIWSLGDSVIGTLPVLLESYKILFHRPLSTTTDIIDEPLDDGIIIEESKSKSDKKDEKKNAPAAIDADAGESEKDAPPVKDGLRAMWLQGEKAEVVKKGVLTTESVPRPATASFTRIQGDTSAILLRLDGLKTIVEFEELLNQNQFFSLPRSMPIILDCRQLYSLSAETAIDIAGYFLPGNAIVASRSLPNGTVEKTFTTTAEGPLSGMPVTVLIDGGTAGGAEVLAAALSLNSVARTIGVSTFGYAFQRSIFPVNTGGEMAIVTGIYRDPKGTVLYPDPVKADVPVDKPVDVPTWRKAISEKRWQDDPVLAVALQEVLKQKDSAAVGARIDALAPAHP